MSCGARMRATIMAPMAPPAHSAPMCRAAPPSALLLGWRETVDDQVLPWPVGVRRRRTGVAAAVVEAVSRAHGRWRYLHPVVPLGNPDLPVAVCVLVGPDGAAVLAVAAGASTARNSVPIDRSLVPVLVKVMVFGVPTAEGAIFAAILSGPGEAG